MYPGNCCTNYTNVVTQYTLVFLVYFGSSTITKNIFFVKCCMVGCSIQNICAIITHIESSICKVVEQKIIYVTKLLCIRSVCNHKLFEETVSKSNFILALLYLRLHVDASLYSWLLNRL